MSSVILRTEFKIVPRPLCLRYLHYVFHRADGACVNRAGRYRSRRPYQGHPCLAWHHRYLLKGAEAQRERGGERVYRFRTFHLQYIAVVCILHDRRTTCLCASKPGVWWENTLYTPENSASQEQPTVVSNFSQIPSDCVRENSEDFPELLFKRLIFLPCCCLMMCLFQPLCSN